MSRLYQVISGDATNRCRESIRSPARGSFARKGTSRKTRRVIPAAFSKVRRRRSPAVFLLIALLLLILLVLLILTVLLLVLILILVVVGHEEDTSFRVRCHVAGDPGGRSACTPDPHRGYSYQRDGKYTADEKNC